MGASSIGVRLFGGAFSICAILAILFGLTAAILVLPIILLVGVVTRSIARLDDRRTAPPGLNGIGRTIEGEYEVIGVREAPPERDSRDGRSASVQGLRH
jgi:hypothetical protein